MDRVAPSSQFVPPEGAVFHFFGGVARRDGPEAFSARTGRASVEGGRSSADDNGLIASVFDGRGQMCCVLSFLQ